MKDQIEMDIELQEHREKQREVIIFRTLRVAMAVLADRGLQYISLLATIGLFSWAMYEPGVGQIITASLFAGVFIVILFRRADGGK